MIQNNINKKNNTLFHPKFIITIIIFLLFSVGNVKADPKVVTSIKPIHSLVSNVMDGVGTPHLIITDTTSPHSFTLKPENASQLEDADLVFWIGEEVESFLVKPLESVALLARKVSFMESDRIIKLKFRENNIFESHKHHDEHDEHEGHDGHHHGEFDSHIWLDPMNAKEMVLIIADELSYIDPSNKNIYVQNANETILKLDKLIHETEESLNTNISFVVFHDAYQYFENRFDVASSGALTVNTDALPGARQVSDIRELIEEDNISCILSEPQFNPKIIETIASDTEIATGVLDPIGATLSEGKEQYFSLIKDIVSNLNQCGR
tara:strand:- start:3690 stop:4658 length:969 start_codon:yes stop_codon:yes gene_type:complete